MFLKKSVNLQEQKQFLIMEKISTWVSFAVLLFIDYIVYKNVFRSHLSQIKRLKHYSKLGEIVEGRIIGFSERPDLDQQIRFAEIVRFESKEGLEFTTISDEYKYKKKPLNSCVSVCYLSEQPTDAIVNPRSQMRYQYFLISSIVVVTTIINVGLFTKILSNF